MSLFSVQLEFPDSKWWYALNPHTYEVLGKARTLERLRKRFPDGMKVLWTKNRIYKLEDIKNMKLKEHVAEKVMILGQKIFLEEDNLLTFEYLYEDGHRLQIENQNRKKILSIEISDEDIDSLIVGLQEYKELLNLDINNGKNK